MSVSTALIRVLSLVEERGGLVAGLVEVLPLLVGQRLLPLRASACSLSTKSTITACRSVSLDAGRGDDAAPVHQLDVVTRVLDGRRGRAGAGVLARAPETASARTLPALTRSVNSLTPGHGRGQVAGEQRRLGLAAAGVGDVLASPWRPRPAALASRPTRIWSVPPAEPPPHLTEAGFALHVVDQLLERLVLGVRRARRRPPPRRSAWRSAWSGSGRPATCWSPRRRP